MESSHMDDLESGTPPRKKIKVLESTESSTGSRVRTEGSLQSTADSSAPLSTSNGQSDAHNETPNGHDFRIYLAKAENEQMEKEIAAGIEVFVSDGAGFQGILKQRYSDFLVNEIMPNGKVARLNHPELLRLPAAILAKNRDHAQATTTSDATDTILNDENRPANGASSSLDSESTSHNTPVLPGSTALNSDGNPDMQAVIDILEDRAKDAPVSNAINLSNENFQQLSKFFGIDQIKTLATMFKDPTLSAHKNAAAYGFVDSVPIDDKLDRRNAHHIVRTIFGGRLETSHKDGNILHCTVAANALSRKSMANSRSKKPGARDTDWNKLGGDYLHFSLYKENRDSGDVLGFLASKLNIRNQKIFDTAGIKDRRAATVQRVSAYRVMADRFLLLNKTIGQSRVGDCSYSNNKLQLGDLAGNEFVITLRDCAVRIPKSSYTTLVPEEIDRYVRQGMQNLRDKGFINYYGLQRFGSFATRTDTIGQYMINGDFKAAVETILQVSEATLEAAATEDDDRKISSDDKKRARALNWFKHRSADKRTILDSLPRRFTAEHAIVSFSLNQKDSSTTYYRGALEAIPRGFRTLYPHAYQSFIWNLAATHRWRLSPGKLIPGDLVLAHRAPQTNANFQTTKYDAQGDPIFEPGHNDRASIHEQYEGNKAYALTAEDIASDHYSIFDIVLPQPGFQVQYPAFMLDFYKTTMATHGNIDPLNMRRNWRDISLPGTYRKLLGRPFEHWSYKHIWYDSAETQITLTDLDVLRARQQAQIPANQDQRQSVNESEAPEMKSEAESKSDMAEIPLADSIERGPRLAIVLKFQLPSSTYATMALRELMKPGPVEFRPEYSAGRS